MIGQIVQGAAGILTSGFSVGKKTVLPAYQAVLEGRQAIVSTQNAMIEQAEKDNMKNQVEALTKALSVGTVKTETPTGTSNNLIYIIGVGFLIMLLTLRR